MAKPELGIKHVCVSCGARFYDLNRSPAVCPKCGAEQPQETLRARRSVDNLPAAASKAPLDDEADIVDLDTETGTDDDTVIEDTSELDDDTDDIGADIEIPPDSDDHDE